MIESKFATLPPEKDPRRPYTAYGGARVLWGCRDKELVIEGPAGTGKTRGVCEKLHFCAMKYDGCRILICRKTRESMTESVLVTFEEKVVAANSTVLNGPKRRLRQTYDYDNGSVIVVGGMDKSSKIMSTEYDIIACFEATEFTLNDHESLMTRLRNGVLPYQQIIDDGNPGPPSHWINRRASSGKMTRILSRHEDNPEYFDQKTKKWTPKGQEYMKTLDNLSGHRMLRLKKGIWAAAEGLVYPQWDPDKHVIPNGVIPRFEIPEHWTRIRSIDFGYENPFVCQWWAIDGDGNMFLYREIYKTKRTVIQHAPEILRLSGDESYSATVCDHDSENRASLDSCGIWTFPAYKDIERGVQAVMDRMKINKVTERPRIFFFADALVETDFRLNEERLPTKTIDEFDSYVMHEVVEKGNRKEKPVDKDNHGMDAMRYAVAHVDNLRGMNIQVTGDKARVING